jgi:hypothetical protein
MKKAIWILSIVCVALLSFILYAMYLGNKMKVKNKDNEMNNFPTWQYTSSVNEVTLDTTKSAFVNAKFEFPEGVFKDVSLALVNSGRKTNVMLISQSAAFDITDEKNINLGARLDENQPQKLKFYALPLKYDAMFANNSDELIQQLLNTDTLRIECQFLVAGRHVLKFYVADLKWPLN